MLKPMIRMMNGWRFELPLALVLGAATAFAMIAMPHGLFVRLPGMARLGGGEPLQAVVATLAALVAAVCGYGAMRRPAVVSAAEPLADDDDVYGSVSPETPVRLRRADVHPDNPVRQPIRARRDLGAPFMDIQPFEKRLVTETPKAEEPVVATPEVAEIEAPAEPVAEPVVEVAEAIDEAPETDLPEATAEDVAPIDEPAPHETAWHDPAPETMEAAAPEPYVAPEPVAETVPETPIETSFPESAPESDATDQPAAERGSTPARYVDILPPTAIGHTRAAERAPRETLSQMMGRLTAGVERRNGAPIVPPSAAMLADVLARPRVARPELRSAVEELNRLAGRS